MDVLTWIWGLINEFWTKLFEIHTYYGFTLGVWILGMFVMGMLMEIFIIMFSPGGSYSRYITSRDNERIKQGKYALNQWRYRKRG
jgi:hypothetical protein